MDAHERPELPQALWQRPQRGAGLVAVLEPAVEHADARGVARHRHEVEAIGAERPCRHRRGSCEISALARVGHHELHREARRAWRRTTRSRPAARRAATSVGRGARRASRPLGGVAVAAGRRGQRRRGCRRGGAGGGHLDRGGGARGLVDAGVGGTGVEGPRATARRPPGRATARAGTARPPGRRSRPTTRSARPTAAAMRRGVARRFTMICVSLMAARAWSALTVWVPEAKAASSVLSA